MHDHGKLFFNVDLYQGSISYTQINNILYILPDGTVWNNSTNPRYSCI